MTSCWRYSASPRHPSDHNVETRFHNVAAGFMGYLRSGERPVHSSLAQWCSSPRCNEVCYISRILLRMWSIFKQFLYPCARHNFFFSFCEAAEAKHTLISAEGA